MSDSSIATSVEISERVRAVLAKRGLQKAEQRNVVSSLLGLSTSQTYKKLNGDSAWDRTQLNILAEHLNVPLHVFLSGTELAAVPANQKAVEATLEIGVEKFPVLIRVAEQMKVPRRVEFAAYKSDDFWHVSKLALAPRGVDLYRIESMEICLAEPKVYSVAILDDDVETVEAICDVFNDRDFIAKPFFSIESLKNSLDTEAFDAFIVDWFVGQQTSEELLAELRFKRRCEAPIILLTGNSEASEFEVHKLIHAYSIWWKQKPQIFSLLASDLGREIELQQKLK